MINSEPVESKDTKTNGSTDNVSAVDKNDYRKKRIDKETSKEREELEQFMNLRAEHKSDDKTDRVLDDDFIDEEIDRLLDRSGIEDDDDYEFGEFEEDCEFEESVDYYLLYGNNSYDSIDIEQRRISNPKPLKVQVKEFQELMAREISDDQQYRKTKIEREVMERILEERIRIDDESARLSNQKERLILHQKLRRIRQMIRNIKTRRLNITTSQQQRNTERRKHKEKLINHKEKLIDQLFNDTSPNDQMKLTSNTNSAHQRSIIEASIFEESELKELLNTSNSMAASSRPTNMNIKWGKVRKIPTAKTPETPPSDIDRYWNKIVNPIRVTRRRTTRKRKSPLKEHKVDYHNESPMKIRKWNKKVSKKEPKFNVPSLKPPRIPVDIETREKKMRKIQHRKFRKHVPRVMSLDIIAKKMFENEHKNSPSPPRHSITENKSIKEPQTFKPILKIKPIKKDNEIILDEENSDKITDYSQFNVDPSFYLKNISSGNNVNELSSPLDDDEIFTNADDDDDEEEISHHSQATEHPSLIETNLKFLKNERSKLLNKKQRQGIKSKKRGKFKVIKRTKILKRKKKNAKQKFRGKFKKKAKKSINGNSGNQIKELTTKKQTLLNLNPQESTTNKQDESTTTPPLLMINLKSPKSRKFYMNEMNHLKSPSSKRREDDICYEYAVKIDFEKLEPPKCRSPKYNKSILNQIRSFRGHTSASINKHLKKKYVSPSL